MHQEHTSARAMPDVAAAANRDLTPLDWVGMRDIDAPIILIGADGQPSKIPAHVSAYVNAHRRDARGIHMSRLYLLVDKALAEPLTPGSIRHLLRGFLESHAELSDRAMVRIAFDHLLRRPALKSHNSGWKAYPLVISGVLHDGQCDIELSFRLDYSSTCPASAALARQLIQEKFQHDFPSGKPLDRKTVTQWLGSEEGICATPHSQRSVAEIRVKLAPSFGFPIVELIDRVEDALKTPVQTAVKREDEQEFALLNGANLMFCEDAARRIHAALDSDERVVDFWVRAAHLESLHPHDAVAITTKGVDGGFRADAG
ncbi:MAG TPA: GTP cyclohydrolase FolE2 [Rudaea sp.]|jgi:GTP cyclohydrolase I|nr:GTP cyclohydrolase FolE2 [Rudaea sp.]